MIEETRKEKHTRQTNEQFEALGRFVQNFEHMVDALRRTCVQFTQSKNQTLVNIVFHHHSLTAGPLFEIARALYGELLSNKIYEVPKDQADVVRGVLKQIATEYEGLLSMRNTMLHGTWFIGWAGSTDTDFSEVNLAKFKIKPTGLVPADTPKDTEELKALSERCKHNTFLINLLLATFIDSRGYRIKENFHKDKQGVWVASTATPG